MQVHCHPKLRRNIYTRPAHSDSSVTCEPPRAGETGMGDDNNATPNLIVIHILISSLLHHLHHHPNMVFGFGSSSTPDAKARQTKLNLEPIQIRDMPDPTTPAFDEWVNGMFKDGQELIESME